MALDSAQSLEFIINHVVLPPKLPQEADDPLTSRAAEPDLLRLVSSRIDSYCRQSPDGAASAPWGLIKTMLSRCSAVVSAQSLSTEILTRLFDELKPEGMSLSSCYFSASSANLCLQMFFLYLSRLRMPCSHCEGLIKRLYLSASRLLHQSVP